jgi:hypothetical protein
VNSENEHVGEFSSTIGLRVNMCCPKSHFDSLWTSVTIHENCKDPGCTLFFLQIYKKMRVKFSLGSPNYFSIMSNTTLDWRKPSISWSVWPFSNAPFAKRPPLEFEFFIIAFTCYGAFLNSSVLLSVLLSLCVCVETHNWLHWHAFIVEHVEWSQASAYALFWLYNKSDLQLGVLPC